MVKSLIKSVNTFRLERLEDVEAFHKKLQEDALKDGYQLTDFKYSVKPLKEDGEVIGEYFVTTYSIVLDDAKDPSYAWNDVEFVQHTKEG